MIRQIVCFELVCDNCKQPAEGDDFTMHFNDRMSAQSFAYDYDWSTGGGGHICESCAEALSADGVVE